MTIDNNNLLRIAALIFKRNGGAISLEEQIELDEWLSSDPAIRSLFEELGDTAHVRSELEIMNRFDPQVKLKDFHKKHPQSREQKLWPRIVAAASIVLAVGVGLYFGIAKYAESALNTELISAAHGIKPGKNKAVLTLADGKVINLNDTKTGVLIGDSDLKYNDGSVIEDGRGSVKSVNPRAVRTKGHLTVKTPLGGTYSVTLPDGTRVWLNAGSSLKFPSVFTGLSVRKVELINGEAYFEVAKDKLHPFIVSSKGQMVQVLGTHFNLNAYEDEITVRTTLLEGSVRVGLVDPALNRNEVLLKPNQESGLTNGVFKVADVNAEKAISWKNGKFEFVSEDIKSILRKISRWYNVEIVYKDELVNKQFTGSFNKFDNVSIVLQTIELTNAVHFKIEGRRILVMK